MPISVECPSCRATIQVWDEHAGRRGRCPRCKTIFRAPAAEAGSGPGSVAVPASTTVKAPLMPAPGDPAAVGAALTTGALSQPATAEEDGDIDALADAPRKAKAVRVSADALPGLGVSARGVVEAAAPTPQTLTPGQILAAFGGRIEPVRPTMLDRLRGGRARAGPAADGRR